jgi:hypothetical protein
MNPAVRYFAQMEKEKYTARSKDMRNVLDAYLISAPGVIATGRSINTRANANDASARVGVG